MRCWSRYVAPLIAIALATALPGFARAQDSFLERFIRAGAPPPAAKRPAGPTIRHPTAPAPTRNAKRSPSSREAQEEQIKTKSNPSTSILVIGDALADKVAQGIDQEFSDNPDIQIVRKTKSVSGLTRQDVFDWVEGARAALSGP